VDVKLEDQQKINAFSRLNTKYHELEAQLAAKKVRARTSCRHPSVLCVEQVSSSAWAVLIPANPAIPTG
jgi:hypothetical protein